MRSPQVFHTIAEYRAWRRGHEGSVGFVPTMGALHAGHGRLLEIARQECDHVVLSVFVNPTQFGPGEDLEKYPRTLESDVRIAASRGVDAVFAPSPSEMYPAGFSTTVEETRLSQPLCGAMRPGHFRGVTTVVLKLFQIVRPDRTFFGLKDAQQFFVLHRMARDLDLELTVEGVPTVRETDGLAMSSRNQYLSPAERETAPLLQRTLRDTARRLEDAHTSGALVASSRAILEDARSALARTGFKPQYLELLSLPGLEPVGPTTPASAPLLLAVAAHLGSTRLIDNLILGEERLPEIGIRVH